MLKQKLPKTFKVKFDDPFPRFSVENHAPCVFTLGFLCLPFGLNTIFPFHMKTQFPRVPRFSLSFYAMGLTSDVNLCVLHVHFLPNYVVLFTILNNENLHRQAIALKFQSFTLYYCDFLELIMENYSLVCVETSAARSRPR